MTKENQAKLLLHYEDKAANYSGRNAEIVKANARKHADEILANYPGINEGEKKKPKVA